MRWNTILFDLDGTVTDPKVGITSAAAYALRTLGLGDHDPDTLTPFIGPPLHLIFPRYGAQSDEQIDRATDLFREYYARQGWAENIPYPGMAAFLAALRDATDDSMTLDEMLRAMYLYVRDSFTYLRRHYYKTGDVGWATQEALTMYSTDRGNCYCYASAFWAAARALGFDAKIVSGTYGEEEAPHGWVEILRGGERYTYDVEIEMAVRRDRGASDLYEMDDSARQRHGYQEFSATDDMLPRSLAGELLPG